MSDNVPITAGAGTSIATDEVGGVHYQKVKLAFGVADAATLVSSADPLPITGTVTANVSGTVPVSGTFFQATQPVSIAATVAVSGPLTDTQLRAAAVGVSGTVTANAGTGTFAVSGPLTDTQLRASAVPVSLSGNQAVNLAQVAGTVTATGNGVVGAGVQRVAIASDNTAFSVNASQSGTWNIGSITTLPALVAGSALIGKVGLDQTTPGTTNAVSLSHVGSTATATGNGVVGAGVQRVAIASDNTAFSVNATQAGTWNIGTVTTLPALPANQSVNVAQMNGVTPLMGNGVTGTGSLRVTIASDNTAFGVNATGPTLTKATQGATGFSTQDLKDAGRAIVNAATAIAGVAAVATEAMLALNVSRDGAATSSITTITVTSGKRFRVQAIIASVRSSAATVLSGRVSLRMNPSGAAIATSPVVAILSLTQQAAALAEAGDTCVLSVPDGIEFSGTMQFGLSQVCSGTGGVVYASIVGFEY